MGPCHWARANQPVPEQVGRSQVWESVQTGLYHLAQWATALVEAQLAHPSLGSTLVTFGAGLLTSLTPCMLSMLPIAVGYLGGYDTSSESEPADGRSRWAAAVQSLWFALGLATTLAVMGVAAAWFGRVYGQVGWGLPLLVSGVAIVMGLNLLEVLPFQFPSLGQLIPVPTGVPRSLRSYLVGLTFGLAASPCSTPVLAALLAWVSATRDPIAGGGLLLAYAIGYVSPLVLVGTFAASLKSLLALRSRSGWIVPTSGALLVGFGVFSLLSRLPIS